MKFSCPRTCPHAEQRTADGHFDCRFRPILDRFQTRVTSHTVRVKVDYTDPDVLKRAVDNLGWKWLGLGRHELFESPVHGHGFIPEGWAYPAVLANGELHADTFNGVWGNDAHLVTLKAEYAIATAQGAALELGWACERTDAGLTVYHPQAGVLTLSKEGICETTGFVGSGCHDARESLKLAADGEIHNKAEFSQVAAQVQTGN